MMKLRYIGRGVRTDINTLVTKFGNLDTLRYHPFLEIWQEMKFSYIYFGRNTYEHLVEFTEELFRIAKEFWLKEDGLNIQTGGLYALYGLYMKQPTSDVSIRLTLSDFKAVLKYHDIIRRENHYDANFIVARLFAMNAFHFCATLYQHSFEYQYKRYFDSDRSLMEVSTGTKYFKNHDNDIFGELNDALTSYHKAKCTIRGPKSTSPPELLNYVNPTTATTLVENFKLLTKSTCGNSETTDTTVIKEENISDSVPWWSKNKDLDERSSSEDEPENIEENSIRGDLEDDVNEQLSEDSENVGMSEIDVDNKNNICVDDDDDGGEGEEDEEEEDDDDDDDDYFVSSDSSDDTTEERISVGSTRSRSFDMPLL